MSDRKKKDLTVELLRIIGALMVIGTHIKLAHVENGVVLTSRVISSNLVCEGVAIFWIVMGFFYFRDDNYKDKLINLLKKVLIPLFIYSAFAFYINGFLFEGKSLVESIVRPGTDYVNLFKGLISWRNAVEHSGHTWFLYSYTYIVVLWPAINGAKTFIDKSKKRELGFVLIIFMALAINYYSENQLFNFSHHPFNPLLAAAFYVLFGYVFYKHKEYFIGNKKTG